MNLRLSFFLSCFTFMVSFAAAAQTAQNSLSTTVEKPKQTSVFDNVILGWKSYNDSARFGELKATKKDPSKGRVLKSKHEFQAGLKFENGWGAYLQNSQTNSTYNDSELNKWALGDPSLTLLHPNWFKSPVLKIGGSVRTYIPMTDRSKDFDTRQYAYYLTTSYNIKDGQEVFNIFIPRWFVTNRYSATDTTFYMEDRTIYTHKFAPWGRWGVGQWTQYEVHASTSPGMTIDVIPQFDYLFTSKIFAGPRVSLPVYVKNSVYDSSKQVSWENAYFEIFMQASL